MVSQPRQKPPGGYFHIDGTRPVNDRIPDNKIPVVFTIR